MYFSETILPPNLGTIMYSSPSLTTPPVQVHSEVLQTLVQPSSVDRPDGVHLGTGKGKWGYRSALRSQTMWPEAGYSGPSSSALSP